MYKIDDITHDRIIFIDIDKSKIGICSKFIYHNEEYIVIETSYRDNEYINIKAELFENYEKQKTVINLSGIEYETLEYLEKILIDNYGYRLIKCKDK